MELEEWLTICKNQSLEKFKYKKVKNERLPFKKLYNLCTKKINLANFAKTFANFAVN
ncbi:hypothetical protein [Flavobacterium sp. PL11]|jgi:hypothetical protein|uniref:hypothetical protein n=1 Tax=Flavobacterium sp. PL11 TaxID=3071717 RepID=UPI002E13BE9C